MPELDDDKTDKLFQVGADRHDFEYNPAAWQQMESLLEAGDLRRRRINWLLAIGGVLLLLLLAFAWLTTGDGPFSKGGDPESPQVETLAEQQGPVEIAAFPLPTETVVDGELEAVEPVTEPGADNGVAQTPTAGKSESPKDRDSNIEDSATLSGGQVVSNATEVVDVKEELAEPQVPVAPNDVEVPTEVLLTNQPARNGMLAISQLPKQAVGLLGQDRDIPKMDVIAGLDIPTFASTAPKPGFAVGVGAGFASGKTKTGSLAAPRFRFGGRLDYRLNNHFSFGTGAFLTKVDYQSDGKEYKVEENFWLYDIVPDKVAADCDILEIPLSVTWHPHGSSQSGFYLGAGLTSYFMLTEKFAFEYDVPDNDLIKGWREDNTNQHLMGVGQISFGFQRKASQRTALQLESFLQLPLTGIGHGGVNLMTVGASVNYTFDFRKRR